MATNQRYRRKESPYEAMCLVEAILSNRGEYIKAYLVMGGEGWKLSQETAWPTALPGAHTPGLSRAVMIQKRRSATKPQFTTNARGLKKYSF